MFNEREARKAVSFIQFCAHVKAHTSPFCPECCWLWTGKSQIDKSNNKHYGVFMRNTPDGRKQIRAHRFVWMLHHDLEIPSSMHLYQHCENTLCCNFSHVFLFQKNPSHKDLQRCFIEVLIMHKNLQDEIAKIWLAISNEKLKRKVKLI